MEALVGVVLASLMEVLSVHDLICIRVGDIYVTFNSCELRSLYSFAFDAIRCV